MANESLEPRQGWRINRLRRCYERGPEERPVRVYPCEGEFVASVVDCWIDGIWPTFEEAAAAAEQEAN